MIGQKDVQREEVRTYDLIKSAGLIDDWSIAIDGGAHVGTWSAKLAEDFREVVAFEPCEESFGYLVQNMAGVNNVVCRNEALMEKTTRVNVVPPPSGRKTLTAREVTEDKKGAIRAVSIDDMELDGCGFIKLDVQGSESRAIRGAVKTIRRFKPVLCIEFDANTKQSDGVRLAQLHRAILDQGYREVFRQVVDRIYAPI